MRLNKGTRCLCQRSRDVHVPVEEPGVEAPPAVDTVTVGAVCREVSAIVRDIAGVRCLSQECDCITAGRAAVNSLAATAVGLEVSSVVSARRVCRDTVDTPSGGPGGFAVDTIAETAVGS